MPFKIRRNVEPAETLKAKYAPIHDVLETVAIGEWIAIEFDDADELEPLRASVMNYMKRRGLRARTRSKPDGLVLYVQRLQKRKSVPLSSPSKRIGR